MADLDVDWLWQFPEENVGLWLLFLATLGAFMIALYQLRRRGTYVEFHSNGWKLEYREKTRTVTVTGLATIVSPAAQLTGTCALKVDERRMKLPLIQNQPHLVYPNTLLLTFTADADIRVTDASQATGKVEIKLSDGSKKRAKVNIGEVLVSQRMQRTAEAALGTPEPAPEEQ